MKRIFAGALALLLAVCLFSACNDAAPTEDPSASPLSGAYVLSDLQNAPIGIVTGMTDADLVKEKIKTDLVVSFNSIDEAVQALRENKVFAVALVKAAADSVLSTNDDMAALWEPLQDGAYVIPNSYSDEEYVAENDILLRVDATLNLLRGNGEYDALFERYFIGDTDAVKAIDFSKSDIGRVLTVGVCTDWKPFAYKNASGDLVGFGVEIANEIAKSWRATVQFVEYPRDELLQAAVDEKVMIAIGPITKTNDVPETVLFSAPYYDETQLLILNEADVGKIPTSSK